MRFAVLGSLQATAGDSEEPGVISAPRLRALLAVLLWRANQPVPADELAELVWDGAPPEGAAEATRALVLRLRRRLGKRVAARVVTRAPGYLIEVCDGELDAAVFEALTRQAGAAVRACRWEDGARATARALGLWRGEPLADVPSQLLLTRWVPHLEQLRVQALEWRIEADLHRGRHEELVPELRDLTAGHPLREHFHVQLMLALYRCGRQAEALAAYQRARDGLVAELGVEPGPALRDLHHRILSADPALAAAEPTSAAADPALTAAGQPLGAVTGPGRVVPRELPSAVRGFTGRSAELAALTGLLGRPSGGQAPDGQAPDGQAPSGQAPSGQAAAPVVISAIGGTAGVGKTALAVHWAHQVAGRFPDGQLYVNLRGYDLGQPVPAAEALAGFLRSLGVPGPDIPPDEDERAARYRSLVAGKRLLVVLDNAGSADQVRPLLPGASGCAVVVTSRDALGGLVARDGATRLDLDALPPDDAVALLRTLIGARADAEPAAAAKLAGQCCRLPLALRIAAELAAGRPAAPLTALTAELADLRTRLDLLTAGGDARTEVRAVFSWSYAHLDAEAARAFRLLGLHPGPDLEPYAVAALTGATVAQTRRTLDALARASLVQPAGPDRHAMHDLLRGYARELASERDAEPERHAALTRLFDHYLHTAAAAMDALFPAERHLRPRIPCPAAPVPPLPDPAAAWDWLDAERPTLVVVAAHAADHDWLCHAAQLANIVSRYLRNAGYLLEALTICSHALDAARRAGDRAAEAALLTLTGNIDAQQGRLQQAADRHRQALALFREAGDSAGEARALSNMGLAETDLGHYEQAARHQQDAAAIFHDLGDPFGEARALGNLGFVRQWQGRYQEAAEYHRKTLGLSRRIGDRAAEAYALARLGCIDLRLGECQRACEYLRQALALFQGIGSTADQAEILARLGDAYLGLGRHNQATGHFERVLAMSREMGCPTREADALNGLGDVLLLTGDPGRARARHAAALRLASKVGVPQAQARSHKGLARAYDADGDSVQARHHWQQALARYDAIGAPEFSEVRARLATAGDDDGDDDDDEPTLEDRGTTAHSPG